MVFLDSNFEPPLCVAVEAKCDAGIVGLLLEHRADVNATDVKGRTPLAALGAKLLARPALGPPGADAPSDLKIPSVPAMSPGPGPGGIGAREEPELRTATRLLAAGADPSIPDSRGTLPFQLALQAKHERLACLLQYYGTVQACLAFAQVTKARPRIGVRLVCTICEHLLPAHAWAHLERDLLTTGGVTRGAAALPPPPLPLEFLRLRGEGRQHQQQQQQHRRPEAPLHT